ncbi:hypothetical protein COL516b_012140 [Colletotrichum fioriniae]|nr:uncharacterized protein COL516b_012140 [Colletotrichum fioriniae]KAJ0295894.1 hypothetical protein COL516b_012140 [Colletotrichum fioriniae]
MSRKHDWVTTLALSYAAGAKIHLSSDITTSPETIDLSPSEYSRFCRAFYRVDLFYVLFGAVGNFNGLSGTGNLLFHRHPPWENEQLGCVHDFVEAKFLEASVDVLAHDVTFGEYQIDYLTTGGDNMMIQLWLSRGLDFLRRLISTTSRESKRVLLESAFNAGRTSLSDALECIMDAHAYNNTDLEDSSTSELGTIIPAYETICNTDKGPYADWIFVREPDVLKLFTTARDEYDEPSAEALEEMEESFKQRSLIWQTSTMTYWSKGYTGHNY